MTIDMIAAATTARIDKSYASDTPAARPAARAATTDAVTQQQKSGEPSRDQLNQAVSELNQSPRIKNQNLQFSIDEDSKRTVVKVVDQETKEVLRQIPTKEALEIARSFEMAKGQLIDQSA
ncbi:MULTISPECIES: flagellar protein FlaG [unclassified Janthinobacterium]|uniref:flagellar protein FlaG n=1 Tax=unclassified Janthinobacterium TaxID=2610881 RepID=UPI00160A40FF|nr:MULTISPECIES: flagellar protein FlaG [unclassified Janthinobacterium]MBB5608690.1 flagellar protein FlaG [Janthinobacterium sp. S3T4]MBB5613907.1 flagellar protein FlaG [Janthinobacterium sp. S3M3]